MPKEHDLIETMKTDRLNTSRKIDFLRARIAAGHETSYTNPWGSSIYFSVYTKDDLKQVRSDLRAFLGTWTDKAAWVSAISEKTVRVGYRSELRYKKYLEITIDFRCDLADLPPTLKKPDCRIEETTTKEYSYICKKDS